MAFGSETRARESLAEDVRHDIIPTRTLDNERRTVSPMRLEITNRARNRMGVKSPLTALLDQIFAVAKRAHQTQLGQLPSALPAQPWLNDIFLLFRLFPTFRV